MEWISVKDRLPETDGRCIVYKRYDWERGGTGGHFFVIEILSFNTHYQCWDDEDGDDYNCDIEKVTHWMPLPPAP